MAPQLVSRCCHCCISLAARSKKLSGGGGCIRAGGGAGTRAGTGHVCKGGSIGIELGDSGVQAAHASVSSSTGSTQLRLALGGFMGNPFGFFLKSRLALAQLLLRGQVGGQGIGITPGCVGIPLLLHAGCAILGVAFLAKAAMWPLNFWLVPAYSSASAPSPGIWPMKMRSTML